LRYPMKYLLLLALSLPALGAQSLDPVKLCERLDRRSQDLGDACRMAIENRVYAFEVVDTCDWLNDPGPTIECLKVTANKHYTDAQITRCRRDLRSALVIQCLKDTGRNVCQPPTP